MCGEGTCRKEHVHHRGNDAADLEADKGRLSEATEDDCQMRGEERCHMTYKGEVCQGGITTTLKLATHENRLSRMENSAKRTEREARDTIQMSNDGMRKAVWKGSNIATRFIIGVKYVIRKYVIRLLIRVLRIMGFGSIIRSVLQILIAYFWTHFDFIKYAHRFLNGWQF